MKKAKFIQDAKLDPSRYYRNPSDVIRDRRLTNQDRLEILDAWERAAQARWQAGDVAAEDEETLQQLRRVRAEVERSGDALESGSQGLGRVRGA